MSQAEIVDESDNFMSNEQSLRIKDNRFDLDVTAFLSMIHNQYRTMSPRLTDAVSWASAHDSCLFHPPVPRIPRVASEERLFHLASSCSGAAVF